jgi:hypothetical protein
MNRKPLLELVCDKEEDIRYHAAWTIGTAIQNNEKSQGHVC